MQELREQARDRLLGEAHGIFASVAVLLQTGAVGALEMESIRLRLRGLVDSAMRECDVFMDAEAARAVQIRMGELEADAVRARERASRMEAGLSFVSKYALMCAETDRICRQEGLPGLSREEQAALEGVEVRVPHGTPQCRPPDSRRRRATGSPSTAR